MLKRITPYLLLLLASSQVFGQETSSCTQTLRLAQTTYENGRLHQMEEILGKCLDNGFNQEERRQAYKLLVQSYIYLEEPEKADAAMLNLLSTDQFFRPNPDVDPAEFVSLYNRFRHKPLFRYGVKLGPAINAPRSTTDYYVGGDAAGTSTFSPIVTFTMGVVFEKDFLKSLRLTIAPEVAFTTRGYVENGIVSKEQLHGEPTTGETPATESTISALIKVKSIDFNPLVKWWLSKEPEKRDQKLEPYVIGGPGFNFLINGSFEDGKFDHVLGKQGTTTGATVDIDHMFRPVNFSAIVGGGARIRLSQVFVNLDVRVDMGLNNIYKPGARWNPDTALDYAWVPNDTFLNCISVNVGLQLAYFNPKKLIK